MLSPSVLAAPVAVVALIVLYALKQKKRDGLPYPPGPKPLPLIGNALDLPLKNEARVYNQWAKQYGDLVHANVLGRHLVFINSAQIANDLFEKRSVNYSDRNELPMINDLMGWDWSFGHMPYGDRWKKHRKMFEKQFKPAVAPTYWPIQRKEAHALIRNLLDSPNDRQEHLRQNAASVIMNVIYGIQIAPQNDRYIDIAEEALDGMAKAAAPGAFLVDILPALKHVPAWMPGAGFQTKAAAWKRAVLEMRDAPFRHVINALSQGKASPCFVSNLVSDVDNKRGDADDQLETIKGCAGLAYAAGAESEVSSLSSFFLAMVLHPDVQRKAQAEIDTVIGAGRLPDFEDRASLPYISAIVKEVLRWNPVAPLGLPHMVTNDDTYNGYFIPAGTTVIGNTWTILHDERNYNEPFRFWPERFLTKDGKSLDESVLDPATAAFGYGRRMCPGRFMADAQLWISVACILCSFEIKPEVTEYGVPKKIEAAFESGMICHPSPYNCQIIPRSEKHAAVVKQTVDLTG
ncbi:cytochrome P450 [Coniophora puteana RWD-64-598 SS2]|uniref:Cytochrome P450 n=1 Tax=Coniophora puteana (strain RWD-64-598) TaxID=741705 RepID=A0A5M3MBP2_CONPW|nr:cytochrome P450 [Coniophora puteana RWD-64-598 SS2]EIW76051.1 cytochrome P450 [Coniophora puteana RWD-64-598 SS2]